ncbi:hypothetical protein N431DRAFT_212718 [Stipitochalara longipes BDJ]|nr:hypothetical protein N431DRAFT_212718 [Stipitochalara longipes BDJ]
MMSAGPPTCAPKHEYCNRSIPSIEAFSSDISSIYPGSRKLGPISGEPFFQGNSSSSNPKYASVFIKYQICNRSSRASLTQMIINLQAFFALKVSIISRPAPHAPKVKGEVRPRHPDTRARSNLLTFKGHPVNHVHTDHFRTCVRSS